MSTSGEETALAPSSSNGTQVTESANQVAAAAAAAVATMPAVAGKKNYVTFLVATIGQAAAAVNVLCTITGLIGGTWSFILTGGTTTGDTVDLAFLPAVVGSAVNTAVVATIPSSGAAGPPIAITIGGYVA